MRVVLFTGKGGVGKTTVSAATAVRAAAAGRKTLVMSNDAAHSLSDALAVPLGPEPAEIEGSLSAMHVDTQRAFERAWREVQNYLFALLDAGGVDPIDAAELVVLPGADEVLALLAVRDAVRSGTYDVICVDCAPTAETLRLLRLPEALTWWISRLYPTERRIARSLGPVLGRMSHLPVPSEGVLDALSRLHGELGDVRRLLVDLAVTSVRLVLTPEQVVVAEARRTLTALALHGYRVDGVIANRVFPSGGDAWRRGWARAQAEQLAEIRASFGTLPLWEVPYAAHEPVGVVALAELAAGVYGDGDPVGPVTAPEPFRITRTADGFALHLALPLATRGSVDLARRGDDLIVGVGGHRRVLSLPSALRRCSVEGARLVHGELVVRFVPDPDLWMRS